MGFFDPSLIEAFRFLVAAAVVFIAAVIAYKTVRKVGN